LAIITTKVKTPLFATGNRI